MRNGAAAPLPSKDASALASKPHSRSTDSVCSPSRGAGASRRAAHLQCDHRLAVAARQLQRTTGLRGPALQTLPSPNVPAQPPVERLGDWLEMAVRQSVTLQAKARAVDVAKLAITRQYAGHLPRLDLIATVSRSENDSISNLGQVTSQRSIGLQLNVPLYSGGGVDAPCGLVDDEDAGLAIQLAADHEFLQVAAGEAHRLGIALLAWQRIYP